MRGTELTVCEDMNICVYTFVHRSSPAFLHISLHGYDTTISPSLQKMLAMLAQLSGIWTI